VLGENPCRCPTLPNAANFNSTYMYIYDSAMKATSCSFGNKLPSVNQYLLDAH